MHTWLPTICVFLLAVLGFILSLLTIKTGKRLWLICYALPLSLILAVSLPRFFAYLRFIIPFIWINAGRIEYFVYAFAIPMLLGTLIQRLPRKRDREALNLLIIIFVLYFSVVPFAVPPLIRSELENIETLHTSANICFQSTNYTCGPAAAVTALMQFGIKADEGQLAIHAYTTPQTGTTDDLLVKAIEKLYGEKGISCTYRYFDSVGQLKSNCPVIAIIKLTLFIDHYITVLEVTDDKVIVGDPSIGIEGLSYEEFKKKWRHCGIIVERKLPT